MKNIRKSILILSCILLVLVGVLVGVLLYSKRSGTEQVAQPTPTYDEEENSPVETSDAESDPILSNIQEYEYNSKDIEEDVKNMNLTLPEALDSSLSEVVSEDELLGVTYLLHKGAQDEQIEMDDISFTNHFENESELILSFDIGYTGTWMHIENEDDNVRVYLGPVLAD